MDFNTIVENLDWNKSEEIQQQGIEAAKKIVILTPFFQPVDSKYNKNIWENCAKIIASKSDDELIAYLGKMFEWIQDINWPGAKIIMKRIENIKEKRIVKYYLENTMIIAKAVKDDTWLENLKNIKL